MPDSSRFGRYEVEEEVARGGMGVIYRVRDPQMRRFLAMKVLRSDVGDEDVGSGSRHSNLAARFNDEAQLTGQLDHPGIIPVYDMGQDEEGRLFFTMRLVKGRTLEEVIALVREGREGWTVTRALGVLQKVCEAMAFAHDRGVIHRDLKPSNVMVGRFGETYVMDWGLAKLVDEEKAPRRDEKTSLRTVLTSARKDESSRGGALETVAGDVMGTPAYMAPEQARGEIQRVGPRSDVYSLGAMLYHLLTGYPPYRPVGESGSTVLERLLAGPPTPVEDEAAAIPPELCAICARAMARQPEERYSGMLDVAADLQAYVENRVVHAYRRGAVIEFRKWVQRNRATAASLAAVFVLVIAGLAAISYIQTRARTEVENTNAQLAATNLELEAERQRTAEALVTAEHNRERAVASEGVALANEVEALWQSYVGNIGAAYAALEVGSASEARRRLAACPEALRGWEWRYLDQRSDGSLRVLTGSETFVTTLAVDPVRSHVVAAGGMVGNSGAPDYTVRIWDFESGKLVRELEGNVRSVTGLAYSPAGDVVVSSNEAGKLHLWYVESGELIAEPSGLGSRIAFHPDGRLLATAYYAEGRITLWDTYESVRAGTRELPAGTNALRFSPDGQSLALAGRDDHIRVLDLDLETVLDLDASGEQLARERFRRTTGVRALDYSPDGRYLVTGSTDGFVRTWDLEAGTRQLLLSGHQTSVLAVRWHPRLPWVVSSDQAGSIRFWDAVTGLSLDVLRGHDEDVHALDFSALGDRLLSASRDRTVRVWDGQAGANDTLLEGLAYPNFGPYRLSFSPDGERIVWRRGLNAWTVTDVLTGEDLCSRWTSDAFDTRGLQFTEAGIWECEAGGRLARWDAETGAQISALDTEWDVYSCDFRLDGRTALVAGYPRGEAGAPRLPELMLVDLTSGAARWTTSLPMHPGWMSVSPDGTRCLVQGRAREREDQGLACFETTSGELVWQVWGLPGVLGMAFFPDGKRLAQTTYNGWDNTLFIRDAETGEVLDRLIGHAQPAQLDISTDGSRIVTGNWDGTLSLWSPERGEILALPAHAGYTANVRLSPDGQTIASLSDDGLRRLWSAAPVEERQTARRAAARRRRWSVDARHRVDELQVTRVHAAAVVEYLEADSSLLPDQRAAAVLLARSEASEQEDVVQRSLTISLDPGRTGAEYMAALDGAKIAATRAPSLTTQLEAETHTANAVVHMAVGAAQLRLGFLREALANLELAEETHALGSTTILPAIEFLKSMAHQRLGEAEAARAAYKRGVLETHIGDPALSPELVMVGRVLELEARELVGRD